MVEYANADMMPRPEEDREREIEREKNRKLAEDLKVNLKFTWETYTRDKVINLKSSQQLV